MHAPCGSRKGLQRLLSSTMTTRVIALGMENAHSLTLNDKLGNVFPMRILSTLTPIASTSGNKSVPENVVNSCFQILLEVSNTFSSLCFNIKDISWSWLIPCISKKFSKLI